MRSLFHSSSLPTAPQFFYTCAASCVVLVLVHLLGRAMGMSPADLSRDITVVAGVHPLAGVLSNLGVLFWCAASAIGSFTALHFRQGPGRTAAMYLLSGALLSTYLMMDDLFMIHETIAGSRTLGLPEDVIYLVLGVAVLAHLMVFHRFLLAIGPWSLVIAIGLLGCSVVTDMLQEQLLWMGAWRSVLEDGFKWLGITAWSGHHILLALRFSRARLGSTQDLLMTDAEMAPMWPIGGWASMGVGRITKASDGKQVGSFDRSAL